MGREGENYHYGGAPPPTDGPPPNYAAATGQPAQPEF